MNIFKQTKENITTRQAAEAYGLRVNRNGMTCCPFHNDKHPSMKVDKNFYCFACGAKGDVIHFVEQFFGVSPYEAAKQELLPEAGKLETGKSYREKKAIPFFKKLMDKLFSLHLAYCRLQDKYKQLERECDQIWSKKTNLERRCDALKERVEELEPAVQDYDRIRNFFGIGRIDGILKEMKEQERLKIEAEKERRKLKRKHYRESR